MKYLKKFDNHASYEEARQNLILPNVSLCSQENEVHYNPILPKATVRLTFTVSEPSKERISVAGDLSPFGGSTDADGLSKVETMRVDGVEVDMETDVTKENIIDMYGVVIDGYFYNFTESGQHTIEYILNDMTVNEGICCTIGNFTYHGISFTSKISNASVEINADEIEGFSFGYSPSIESVTIGNSVTSIGEYAFYNCTSLASVNIPSGVTSIGASVFAYCNALTGVTIPSGVTSIGDSAFQDCSGLTSVNIPSGVTSIGNGAFSGCFVLTGVTIPSGVTSIGNSTFDNCHGFTNITIPNSVTSIGDAAFAACSQLTSVTIPDSVTSIGDSAFNGCNSLTSAIIGSSVTSIGDKVFYNCTSLASVNIPIGVTSIGSEAFKFCSSLTSITSLATTAPTITSYTFQYISSNGTLTVPIGSSGYDVWMGTGDYYLGKYGWTKVEQ